MRRWLVLGWFLSFLNACSDEKPPPLTSARPNRGGNSGTSGRGGDNGMGGEPTSGTGGTAGGGGGTATFDPDEIYLAGTIGEGNSNAKAFAKLGDLNLAILGFPGDYGNTTAAFLDGKLIYQTLVNVEVRQFVPDGQTGAPYNINTYPRMPEANDLDIPTDPCSASENAFIGFLTGPDGQLVYECANGWYKDGEELDTNGYPLFALGHDDLALIAGVGIIDLARHGIVADSPAFASTITARSYEDGFYVVVGGTENPVLWEIPAANATARELGTYPAPPDGLSPFAQTSELGPDNALYEIATASLATESIIRRTIDGVSEVLYTETEGPMKAEPFTSVLVTGP